MTRQVFDMIWDHLRQANGIALRCAEAIPKDAIDARPIPGMRTPKELLVHLYGTVIQGIVVGIATGAVPADIEEREVPVTDSIRTHAELVQYCRTCWDNAHRAATQLTDAQIQGIVRTPFGADYPGFVLLNIVRDELFHHRGQLYCYLRALGVEPPDAWSFKQNEPAFQPKAPAQS